MKVEKTSHFVVSGCASACGCDVTFHGMKSKIALVCLLHGNRREPTANKGSSDLLAALRSATVKRMLPKKIKKINKKTHNTREGKLIKRAATRKVNTRHDGLDVIGCVQRAVVWIRHLAVEHVSHLGRNITVCLYFIGLFSAQFTIMFSLPVCRVPGEKRSP